MTPDPQKPLGHDFVPMNGEPESCAICWCLEATHKPAAHAPQPPKETESRPIKHAFVPRRDGRDECAFGDGGETHESQLCNVREALHMKPESAPEPAKSKSELKRQNVMKGRPMMEGISAEPAKESEVERLCEEIMNASTGSEEMAASRLTRLVAAVRREALEEAAKLVRDTCANCKGSGYQEAWSDSECEYCGRQRDALRDSTR